MKLTVDEALALTERRKGEWCLLGINLTTNHKTYMCRACGKWVTLVTLGAVLPSSCMKCGIQLRPPHDEKELLNDFRHEKKPDDS